MFWLFMLVAGLSSLLIKVGAMSVWIGVLSLLLKLAALALLALAGVAVWKSLKKS